MEIFEGRDTKSDRRWRRRAQASGRYRCQVHDVGRATRVTAIGAPSPTGDALAATPAHAPPAPEVRSVLAAVASMPLVGTVEHALGPVTAEREGLARPDRHEAFLALAGSV